MSKRALIAAIADKFDSNTAAERAVDTVLNGIKTVVRGGEPVTLNGFGRFQPADRAARKGRNPRTNEEIDIAARKVMTFSSKVTF